MRYRNSGTAMNKDDFINTATERFSKARDFWHNWRAEALDAYAFISGDQWLSDDTQILDEQKRPPITFNYSEKMIDAVVGAEVSNRQEVTYEPRSLEDSGLADLWNAAAKWVRNECNAEDEESDAFRDALICGMGWTWTHLDYETDPDGKVIVERIDPLEMIADPAASKPGLVDRRWHSRLYWVDDDEVQRLWPNALLGTADDPSRSSGVIVHGHRYSEDDDDDTDRHKNQTQIRYYECYELEPIYRVANGDQIAELSVADFRANKDRIEQAGLRYVKQQKRVYYVAWFSGETLLQGPERSPCQKGFCFNAITGKRDRNKNTWYGLTRVMKDPQRWANKWLSQILHIINTNAKGGLMAEIGAFVDPVRAQEEWSQPDSITLFNEGALSGGKVQQKQQAPYPSGLDKLMSFALESLPMVTGINLEALGLANREQAGVLEAQRKQAAYGLLSPMFDALRRYRKEQGHVLLYYIREYISDGRLIRIGGPENQQYVPLTKTGDDPSYDIIVDQSPNAPDTKQKTWDSLIELIPAMLKAGVPIPPDVLDYVPLPTALAQKWKQFVGQQQQGAQQMQQQIQELQQENQQLQQDQQIKLQELQFKQQEMAVKIQMDQEAHAQQMALEREKAAAEFELEQFKQNNAFDLERRRASHEASMKQQQVDNEFRVKAFAAGLADDSSGNGTGANRKISIGIDTSSITQALQQAMQMQQQTTETTTQLLAQLARVLGAPRRLVKDETGQPIGSEPVLQQ